jgi:hypothetical protein
MAALPEFPSSSPLFLRLRSEEVADAQRSGVRRLAAAFLAASLLAVFGPKSAVCETASKLAWQKR